MKMKYCILLFLEDLLKIGNVSLCTMHVDIYVSFSLSRCGACLGHHFKGNVMIENLT